MASNVTPTASASGGGIRTKTVVIHNVKSDVTVESLRATLALDADPVVTTHTKISLSSDNDTDVGVRSAQITTLDSLVPHLLALDGKMVDGRPWAVTEVPPDASSHVESDPVVPEYSLVASGDTDSVNGPPQEEEEQQEIQFMIIDCRSFDWIWNQVSIVEIIEAVEIDHEEDYTKSIGRLKTGLWSLDSDNFQRYVGKSIKIRGVDIPLTPKYKPRRSRGNGQWSDRSGRAPRREGTLITIFGAYKRHNRHISGELFDQAFQSLDGVEVIKPTQPQKNKRNVSTQQQPFPRRQANRHFEKT